MIVAMSKEKTWCPAIEFNENDNALILKAEVPGVERKQLNVRVKPDSVVITRVHPKAKHSVEKEIIQNYTTVVFSVMFLFMSLFKPIRLRQN